MFKNCVFKNSVDTRKWMVNASIRAEMCIRDRLFVIPIFIDMFADLDVEMPALTMAVMNTSKWTASHWYVILIVVALIVFAYRTAYKTDTRCV